MPTVGVVAVIEENGRLLVIRRAAHILAGGTWCFPGGGVEPGETLAEAVVREVREEIGLAVEPLDQLWTWKRADGRLILHWWRVQMLGPAQVSPNPDEVAEARWL